MNVIFFDAEDRERFLPFAFTRPVCDIRIGITTLREKWETVLSTKGSVITEPYLRKKYPVRIDPDDNLLLNAAFLPTDDALREIRALEMNAMLFDGENVLALRLGGDLLHHHLASEIPVWKTDIIKKKTLFKPFLLRHWTDIFLFNGKAISLDYNRLTANRQSCGLDESNKVFGSEIFVEKGAKLRACILNAETGPIYIGRDAEVMEGAMLRGPVALCENSQVKMGARIYGPTTIGPHSKAGGEISNSVIFGYSNKGHDGFIGNTVIGEWCNLGADTNTSNLKNNYATVKLWDAALSRFVDSGLQFCGMAMGDHSKSGINTMFNTGTTVGVSANIFGSGFPRTFIPSFSWGGREGFTTFKTDRAFEVAEAVMKRRGVKLTKADKDILLHIFKMTETERRK